MRAFLVAVAVVAAAAVSQPAWAAKSKMGCEIGKEVWNASAGKCEPGKPKPSKAPAKKAPGPAKKAP